MPPPAFTAVTVAPATGSFAALVTMPTIAPDDTFTTAAGDCSARTTDTANPDAAAKIRTLRIYFGIFINFHP
jgi:hypothetical protein